MNKEIIYGLHAARQRLKIYPDSICEIFCQSNKHDKSIDNILLSIAKKNQINIKKVDKALLDKMTSNALHQGIVLICEETRLYNDSDLDNLLAEAKQKPFILVLDNVQDPHNFGACIRSADAAGVDFIIFPKDKSSPVSSVVRKVACGAADSMKLVVVTNLARSLRQLKDAGVWLIGLASEASDSLFQMDLTDPVAIVMGAEGVGLRKNTKNTCDYLANLPMAGKVASLNVSVATGISLYEVQRQRLNNTMT